MTWSDWVFYGVCLVLNVAMKWRIWQLEDKLTKAQDELLVRFGVPRRADP